MIIEPIDHKNDLFLIQDFYPQDLLERFITVDHLSQPYTKEVWQTNYPRRRVMLDADPIYNDIDLYIKSNISNISKVIGLELTECSTGIWLDEPGFMMQSHLDSFAVQVSIQIYLNENDVGLGTVFYNNTSDVRYHLPYKINQGYLMINNPALLHGMKDKVPDNSYRISSYTWFWTKT